MTARDCGQRSGRRERSRRRDTGFAKLCDSGLGGGYEERVTDGVCVCVGGGKSPLYSSQDSNSQKFIWFPS